MIFTVHLYSQKGEIKGTVKDPLTNETVIGASVMYASGKGTVTDINGNYSIKLDTGTYTITFLFLGYEPFTQKVTVGNSVVTLDAALKLKTLDEVEIVSDVAKNRETPVAFSNVGAKQIEEEIGTRDVPMILNTTPGVYATEQGGGSGDARMNMRGFDQTNIAVMIDGVPVNDMENGQVFWSNWSGIGDVTREMQVQRGLGASKLAIPSVGGTVNIITKGIDQKFSVRAKQEVTDYGLFKTTFGVNTGNLKGNWGITAGGSHKWGEEWVDGTPTKEWAYFFKVQKRFKKQVISLSVIGATQSHGQRYSRLPIGIYSKKLADKLGINTDSLYRNTPYTTATQGERGLRYNPEQGTLNGDVFNSSVNHYNKPAFNLSHFWNPTEKITVSTVAYLSVGSGGTSYLKTSIGRDSANGQLNVQPTYDANIIHYSPFYSTTEHSATNYLLTSVNQHLWYGVLSSLNYKFNENFNILAGIDARYYKGTHYQTPFDLLGADYMADGTSDPNQPNGAGNYQYYIKRLGDRIVRNYDVKVNWGGLFAQAEYKRDKWSAFLTGSISDKSYQRIDYFKKKDLLINGSWFPQEVGYGDALYYNSTGYILALKGGSVTTNGDTTFITNPGKPKVTILNATKYTINSPEAKEATTNKKWFPGYTIKGGANYNINLHHNVFINLGYMNMAPASSNVFDLNNHEYLDIENQKVYAIEGGYGLHFSRFATNLNLYYTLWKNKPFTGSAQTPDGTEYYNVNGMDALHKGIEVDGNYKIMKNLSADAFVSIGDWKTISARKAYIYDQSNNLIDSVDFSAKGVHVGDAAQWQFGGALRYEIIKNLYIKPRFTYFMKHYANFDPTTLVSSNKDRESWLMPPYGMFDLFAGYDKTFWKINVAFTVGVTNLLNTVYITDGLNGKNFDASTTTVYMGMGRRITFGLKVGF